MPCGCNDTYNGNCNCSEPVDLLTTIAIGPTGATGAAGANGADGVAVWYDSITVQVGNTVGVITEEVLNTYTIDNTPTVALGNGDVLYIEALFSIVNGYPSDREVRIRLDGTTLVSYIFPGHSTPPTGFSHVELHVVLHKISNTSEKCTRYSLVYGNPDSMIHNAGMLVLAKNFVTDLVVDTTCICSVAAATNDVVNNYLLIKRAKHV